MTCTLKQLIDLKAQYTDCQNVLSVEFGFSVASEELLSLTRTHVHLPLHLNRPSASVFCRLPREQI